MCYMMNNSVLFQSLSDRSGRERIWDDFHITLFVTNKSDTEEIYVYALFSSWFLAEWL